jgi:hypothetical protein
MDIFGQSLSSSFTGDLEATGSLELGGDAVITGNLTVTGTTTTINTETLTIEDSMVKYGLNNPANLVDGGFIVEYKENGIPKYSGLIRDKSDSNKYKSWQ